MKHHEFSQQLTLPIKMHEFSIVALVKEITLGELIQLFGNPSAIIAN